MSEWNIWDILIGTAYAFPRPGGGAPKKASKEEPKPAKPAKPIEKVVFTDTEEVTVITLGPIKQDSITNLAQMALTSLLKYCQKTYPDIGFKDLKANFLLFISYDTEKKAFGLVFKKHPAKENDLEITTDKPLTLEAQQKIRQMFFEFFSSLLLTQLNKTYQGAVNPYSKTELQQREYNISAAQAPEVNPISPAGISKKQLADRIPDQSRRAFLRGRWLKGAIVSISTAAREDTKSAEAVGQRAADGPDIESAIGLRGSRRRFVATGLAASLALFLYSKFSWAFPRPKKGGGGEAPVKKTVKKGDKPVVEDNAKVKGTEAVTRTDGEKGQVPSDERDLDPISQGQVDERLDAYTKEGKLDGQGTTDLTNLSGKVGHTGPADTEKAVAKAPEAETAKVGYKRPADRKKTVAEEPKAETPTLTTESLLSRHGLSKAGLGFIAMEVVRILPRITTKSLRYYEDTGKPFWNVPFLRKHFIDRGILVMDVLKTGEVSARLHVGGTKIEIRFKLNEGNYNKYHLFDPDAKDYKTTLNRAKAGDLMALLRLYVYSAPENLRADKGFVEQEGQDRNFIRMREAGTPSASLNLNGAFIYMLYNLLTLKTPMFLKEKEGRYTINQVELLVPQNIGPEQLEIIKKRFVASGLVKANDPEMEMKIFEIYKEFSDGQKRALLRYYAQSTEDEEEKPEIETIEGNVQGHLDKVLLALFNTMLDKDFPDGKGSPSRDAIASLKILYDKLEASLKGDKKEMLYTEGEVTQALTNHYKTVLVPIIALMAWELLETSSTRSKLTSIISIGLSASIGSVASDKLFRDRIQNADEFLSEHGYPLSILKDVGLDFITYAAVYAACALLEESVLVKLMRLARI